MLFKYRKWEKSYYTTFTYIRSMTSITFTSKKEICPVVESIYAIGNKWSLVIIYNLMKSPKRFNDLKGCIQGISSKVLTENLQELSKNGIIEKRLIPEQQEKTEYVLTQKGEDLRDLMMEMRSWGERWLLPPEEAPVAQMMAQSVTMAAARNKIGSQ